ncbi:MAG: hypothetical protein ABJA93_05955 [Sporichthyaceae bacterium]
MATRAVVGLLGFLAWAYLGSGPGRYEWVDSAVVLGPFGLLLGALVGAGIGHYRR